MNELQIKKAINGAVLLCDESSFNDDGVFIIPNGKYLGEIFDRMLFGRIDKKVTGIGATTLELQSNRNSIIVVPSQYLAYSKSLISENYKYVGGEISGKISGTTVADIKEYTDDENIKAKKLICVAESLWKVIEVIKHQLKDWFIMLDEIDTFQEQSNFRDKLEVQLITI